MTFLAKIFSIAIALLFPWRANSWILASDTAVKAVSELEKKPDKIINKRMLHKKINISGIISLRLRIFLEH